MKTSRTNVEREMGKLKIENTKVDRHEIENQINEDSKGKCRNIWKDKNRKCNQE